MSEEELSTVNSQLSIRKEIAIFSTDKETINVEVLFEDETVWLTQDQMATLFEKAKSTINEHIKHIFEEGELEKLSLLTLTTTIIMPQMQIFIDLLKNEYKGLEN